MKAMKRLHQGSRRSERKLEKLCEVFRKLAEKSEDTVVLVEGRKDRAALRRLGVGGTIVCMQPSGHVLVDFLDRLPDREVVLLVDFDEYGASLARKITQYLEAKRVKVNGAFWRKIRGLVRRDVKDIEGLPSYLEKLKKSPTTTLRT